MNLLIAGHGNISRALLELLKQHPIENLTYTVCDIKDGTDCRDLIVAKKDVLDAVLNLTTQPTDDVLNLCIAHQIDYIDCGIEDFPQGVSPYDYFNRLLSQKTQSRVLLGFGMNPGLAEYIYHRHAPDRHHIGMIFEFDDGHTNPPSIFNTWSPASYFDEAVRDEPFIAHQKKGCVFLTEKLANHPYIPLKAGNTPRRFRIIPHEEVFSLCRTHPLCDVAAFVYQAPLTVQSYFVEQGATLSDETVLQLPTLYDILGTETVGALYYDYTDHLTYAYNRVDHAACFRQYHTNGTCWQTACGAYTAVALLSELPQNAVVTVSDIAPSYAEKIDLILDRLGFKIEVKNDFVCPQDFKAELLPYLQ